MRATLVRTGTPRRFASRRSSLVSRFAPPVCLLRPSAVSQNRRPLRTRTVSRSCSRHAAATRPGLGPPPWFLTTSAVCSDDSLPGCCTRLRPWGSRRARLVAASRRRLTSPPPRFRPSEGLLPLASRERITELRPEGRHPFTALRFPLAVALTRSTSGLCSNLRSACGRRSCEWRRAPVPPMGFCFVCEPTRPQSPGTAHRTRRLDADSQPESRPLPHYNRPPEGEIGRAHV